jgi:hypothetical protein
MNVSSEMLSANLVTYEVGVGTGAGGEWDIIGFRFFVDDGSFPCRINCSRNWGGIFGRKD